MEPKFQTSFIPKKSVSSAPQAISIKASSNMFYAITIFIFIATLLLCGGLFFYKQLIIKQIESANKEISTARDAFQEETIKEILSYNDRISFANKILNNHIILYPMFMELENLTLKNVSFSNFVYSNVAGVISLSSNVTSKNYNALAQQSLAFSNSKYIKNSVFSNFQLTETGDVSAKFTLNLDPSLVSYKTNVESSNLNQ